MNTANPAPPLLTTLQWQLADPRIYFLLFKKKKFFLKTKKQMGTSWIKMKKIQQKEKKKKLLSLFFLFALTPPPLKLTLAYRAGDSHGILKKACFEHYLLLAAPSPVALKKMWRLDPNKVFFFSFHKENCFSSWKNKKKKILILNGDIPRERTDWLNYSEHTQSKKKTKENFKSLPLGKKKIFPST